MQNQYPGTHIYDHSLSCFGTGTFIKKGGAKLVLWGQTSLLSEMIQSYASVFRLWVKCQPTHVTDTATLL